MPRPLLAGNGRPFSSLLGCLVYHSQLTVPRGGRKSERKCAGDAGGLLFNLEATQQSKTHLSRALKVILSHLTHIHLYPWFVMWMYCRCLPLSCLEHFVLEKNDIFTLYGESVQDIDQADRGEEDREETAELLSS